MLPLSSSNNEADEFMYLMFDGQHHMDEICMRCQLSETEIMEKIEDDHNVLCIIKWLDLEVFIIIIV